MKSSIYKAWVVLFFIITGCSESIKTTRTNTLKQQGPSIELKVMTYNIHHGNPPSKEKDGVIELPAIAKVIAAESPDIVFLQEIDDHNSRSGKDINQAESLAKQLGMNYYFGKAIDFAGGGYGIAILSRLSLSDPKVYFLPKAETIKSEQRVLLTAVAMLENKTKLRIACTHLDVVSGENRVMQCDKIIECLRNDSLPVILGGDFNDTLNSKAINGITDHFKSSCNPCMPTVPADKPHEAIDFIFTDKKYKWRVVSYYVGEDAYASDHRFVISKLASN